MQWSISSGSWEPVYKGKGASPWKRWSRWVSKWQDKLPYEPKSSSLNKAGFKIKRAK